MLFLRVMMAGRLHSLSGGRPLPPSSPSALSCALAMRSVVQCPASATHEVLQVKCSARRPSNEIYSLQHAGRFSRRGTPASQDCTEYVDESTSYTPLSSNYLSTILRALPSNVPGSNRACRWVASSGQQRAAGWWVGWYLQVCGHRPGCTPLRPDPFSVVKLGSQRA